MNILFVSPHNRLFRKASTGTEQRTHLLIKALTEIGTVDIIAFHKIENLNEPNINILYNQSITRKTSGNITRLDKWRTVIRFWDKEAMFPRNEEKSKIVKSFLKQKNYDIIVTRYIHRAFEYGLDDYYNQLIVDVDDLPADIYEDLSKNAITKSSQIRNRLNAKISNMHTRKLVNQSKVAFFPNPFQAKIFSGSYLPNIPYHQNITCNTIDFAETNKRLFFIGLLDYAPNYTGIDYFLKNVYLKLYKVQPDIEFHIAGKISNEKLKNDWERYPNVKVLGFVDDIIEAYTNSRVVVIPIYSGAGTNIKLLESMRMNRACAVSEFSTRGLTTVLENKKDYFIAYSDEEYVENILNLLLDETLNKTTAKNAYEKVNKHFSYNYFSEVVKNEITN